MLVDNPIRRWYMCKALAQIGLQPGERVLGLGPGPGSFSVEAARLATPFLLGSLWAMIPAALSAGLYMIRTGLEDRTLIEELPGYTEYAQQTRFRLVPGAWSKWSQRKDTSENEAMPVLRGTCGLSEVNSHAQEHN